MYLYTIINKYFLKENIISPILLHKINTNPRYIHTNINLEKNKIYKCILNSNLDICISKQIDQIEKIENENEFILIQDYRSFRLYTKYDYYEYCNYCEILMNKIMDDCCICSRKTCGDCESYFYKKDICEFCDSNTWI